MPNISKAASFRISNLNNQAPKFQSIGMSLETIGEPITKGFPNKLRY